MKVLFIDPMGAALDTAMRAQQDGHKVKLFIRQTEKTKYIGRGLVDVVDDFHPWMNWPDLIVHSDNTRYLREFDTHEALAFTPGVYRVRRQREATPEGWQRAQD